MSNMTHQGFVNGYISKEGCNLLRSFKNLSFCAHAIFYWGKVLFKMALGKLGTSYYPPYLKRILNKSKIVHYEKGFIKKLLSSSESRETFAFTIPVLSTKHEERREFKTLPNWFQTFDDHEKEFAIHRWGWLLMHAVENPSIETRQWGINVMNDWFLKLGDKRNHPAWESYSVSERIVNSLLFLFVLRNFPCNKDEDIDSLEKNLIEHSLFLKDHLEFHGELTNNHILNNARALYMIGQFAACKELAAIGSAIFNEETPKMITTSGFLREDSSSYHLLILRIYLEVLWAAEYSGDHVFAEKMKPIVILMLKAGWMLSVYDNAEGAWKIPLIGDVSPDFPVKWLSNICRSKPAIELYNPFDCKIDTSSGWNKIWGTNGSDTVIKGKPVLNLDNNLKIQIFDDSGWYKVDYADIVIFWHVNPSGCIPLYSHGHNDIFSFVLYWKGYPIIVDPGRFSYSAEQFGLYGKKAQAHNTFTLNGFEPYPLTRYIYPAQYRKGMPRVQWEKESDEFYFRIVHDGFQRINKYFYTFREFHVTPKTIKILDSIEGSGNHTVKTFFHFGDPVKIMCTRADDKDVIHADVCGQQISMELMIKGGKSSVQALSGIRDAEPTGWFFPDYGNALPITTCIVEARMEFPYLAEYLIKFPE